MRKTERRGEKERKKEVEGERTRQLGKKGERKNQNMTHLTLWLSNLERIEEKKRETMREKEEKKTDE